MIVGIDLGTTHSLIGYYSPDGPRLIPNALGSVLTPSVVAIDDQKRLLVGEAARDKLAIEPACGAGTFKRFMGTDRQILIGNQAYRAEELSAMVLRALVTDAEAHLGTPIKEAVISVPAYFSDAQRKATRAAGELAGLKVERLINEPTAAALAYGLQEKKDEATFLVFDLGGGTFDVSILEVFDGVMQVHATCGDNHLGGEDFLQALLEDVCSQWNLRLQDLPASLRAQLASRVERAKRQLSLSASATIEMKIEGRDLTWNIDEPHFAKIVDPLIQRLRQPIERALRDARLDPQQLDEIVLVGGASRMPLVSRLVARMLGRLPLRHINPDEAVAVGAAVAAGMKARDERLEEVVLTDVSPYTLGVATARLESTGRQAGGYFAPLIERNSTVPVSRVERFWPLTDMQTELRLEVYQGESPMVANNIRLGQLLLKLPPRPVQENPVDVRFTYDVNGVLQVEVSVISTGERHELFLEQNPGTLSQTEIAARFAALSAIKTHPREDLANIALMARAERLYAEHLGDARRYVQDLLARYLEVLESQNLQMIARARQQLISALDEFEGSNH
ncbi:MAG: molecular chaperone HscC [Arenimonas sp. SCN 70-307]|mgnify:CR=1 FL=1|uniref:molecular chaperone HscC n=1 Tax=Arenimonas sp. SCN 70-307 TaxID=1660089 RepID=UPI00086A8447|nr:molecular chaperone HscC [Arenimonas sp. SCN 70-307]ODS64944.1 MAG: molecular chaperone HscC [Arenimonas sp. SCN 70-307]